MNPASASLELDSRALRLLGQLLDATAAQRDAQLAQLSKSDPALQARLTRLLAADAAGGAEAGATSRLAAPWVQGDTPATSPVAQPGQLIAGYRLLREIGRGGMSSVWLAERAEGGLKREVALKLPLVAHLSEVLAERFARERDVLAALDHPHIARLFDAGVAEGGQPYLVLEHVAGRSITEHAQTHQLPPRQRLLLFQQVLSAVDHAHRHMVVHRDLKPSNILVTDAGGVKLLDFGIAKLLDAPIGTAALTQEAGAALTPRYAAPEQVQSQPITNATDVYSAGVVLYELLTGRHPHGPPDASALELMQAAVWNTPARPGLSADLDTVLLKSLRKAPNDRYASIERFAEDLRRLLAHEPILARRVPWGQRVRLALRRHPRASAAVALAAAALLAVGAIALAQFQSSRQQATRAAAVRNFLFEMVSDAEPNDNAPDGEVTGRQIVDAAVARARRDFGDQPLVRGEVLGELGRLYNRLNRPEESVAVLDEAIALLEHHTTPGHGGLNKARIWRAEHLRMAGHLDEAQALTQRAMQACSDRSDDCLKVQAHGQGALRNLAVARGNGTEALDHARSAVHANTLAFGAESAETGAAWQFLAVVARNAARFSEAGDAIAQAVAVAQKAPLRAADAITLARTQAVVDIDLGRYEAARNQLAGLVVRTEPALERATQWRLLSVAHFGLGDFLAARDAAGQAAQAAHTATSVREELFAQQNGARAEAMLGHAAAAARQLEATVSSLRSLKYAEDSVEVLRARRLHAEALLRRGDLAAATTEVATVLEGHGLAKHPHPIDWALALDLAGALALAEGRATEASRLHAAAGTKLATSLAANHPLNLRNKLYAALANHRAQPSAASQADLKATLQALLRATPAGSGWLAVLEGIAPTPEAPDPASVRTAWYL